MRQGSLSGGEQTWRIVAVTRLADAEGCQPLLEAVLHLVLGFCVTALATVVLLAVLVQEHDKLIIVALDKTECASLRGPFTVIAVLLDDSGKLD